MSPILHNSPSNVLPKVVTVGLNLRNAFPRFNLTAVMLLLPHSSLSSSSTLILTNQVFTWDFHCSDPIWICVDPPGESQEPVTPSSERIFGHSFFLSSTILCLVNTSFGFSSIGSLVFSPGRGKKKVFFSRCSTARRQYFKELIEILVQYC